MPNESVDNASLLVLIHHFPHEHLERVAKWALDHIGQASAETRKQLEKTIRREVKLKGFADASKAIAGAKPLVAAQVVEVANHSGEMAGALIAVWAESQGKLRADACALLADRSEEIVERIDIKEGLQNVWWLEEMKEAVEAFQTEHKGYDDNDIALMLCWLTGRMPLERPAEDGADGEDEDDQETEAATNWAERMESAFASTELSPVQLAAAARLGTWVDELDALPPDAPEWQLISVLTATLEEIAARKREALSLRTELIQALNMLSSEQHEELEWFSFDISTWSLDNLTVEKAKLLKLMITAFNGDLGLMIAALSEDLARHASLRNEVTTTRQQEQQRRKEMEKIELAIETFFNMLQSVLGEPLIEPAPALGAGRTDEVHEAQIEGREGEATSLQPAGTAREQGDERVAVQLLIEEEPIAQLPEPIAQQNDDKEEHAAPAMANEEVLSYGLVVSEPGEGALVQLEETVTGRPAGKLLGKSSAPAPLPQSQVSVKAEHGEFSNALTQQEALEVHQSEGDADARVISIQTASDKSNRVEAVEPLAQPAERATHKAGGDYHLLFWSQVAEGDLSAAYWLARSLIAQGIASPAPDWLLAALQASRWLTYETTELAHELAEIVESNESGSDPAHQMLALAAAINPALIAPYSQMMAWLEAPSCCTELGSLVIAVKTFAALGIALQPGDASTMANAEQRNDNIAHAARAVKRWLDEAPRRRKRAGHIWSAFLGQRGDLRTLLTPIAEDRRSELSALQKDLQRWQQHGYVDTLIDQINQTFSDVTTDRVTGAPRQELHREIEDALALAERWCELTERARHIESRGNWYQGQVMSLRAHVDETLPAVDVALSRLIEPEQLTEVTAAAHCMVNAVEQLRKLLDLPAGDHKLTKTVGTSEWLALPGGTLYSGLNQRLLCLPELRLADDCSPLPDTLPEIGHALMAAASEKRTIQKAAREWLEQQDYRFVDDLAAILNAQTQAADFLQEYQDALIGSRAALRSNIAETDSAIEQALVDGVIAEEERSRYNASFASLSVDDVRNFRAKFAEMTAIRRALQECRAERLAHLRERWAALDQLLSKSHISQEKQDAARSVLQSRLELGDTRVVDECLARLQEALDSGEDLPADWYAPGNGRDYLEEFNRTAPRIERWLAQNYGDLKAAETAAREGLAIADIKLRDVPAPRRNEAAGAFEGWRVLKQHTAKGNNSVAIAKVLQYLTFDLKATGAAAIEIMETGPDWLHARAAVSAGELARPIPEFGSQAPDHLDVVCLWERPGPDAIAARMHDLRLDTHTVIVFYLGRLTVSQRREVIRVSRDRELAIAVLDETLLVFLAQERDARLPGFLRCALPFSALNPYRPFQAGDVPPEMFFGRESMARELQRPAGSCIVYGGRQLGKSALLRHVAGQFHHPDRQQYAWVEAMNLVFDPPAGRGTQNLWRALRDGMKRVGLLGPRVTTDKPEEIARYTRQAMEDDTRRRVLVMWDEADDFLDADARDGFRVVTALRELMLSTSRRFKVVFAGLHNVQRFQGIPNQPLAHFGAPLCVGPLEPSAAQQLVRQPLDVLGYRFADEASVLRILSYTNYHPGLIQFYCQELLKQLRDGSNSASPPYKIEQSDVEAIYRTQQVRDRIRERFDWTLALDTHYQAIAWTLIEAQMKIRDSYAQAYPPGEILRMARDWWPVGFNQVGSDQLRGWLDELCGLGVLVRNTDGHYRLRSPNLVRLLGKEGDIVDRLLELTEKLPVEVFDGDSHHAPLDDDATRYSPLTYAQERSLAQPRFGVGLVFASEALGIRLLPDALRRFIPADLPTGMGTAAEAPGSLQSDRELTDWLTNYLKTQENAERLVVYVRCGSSDAQRLASFVHASQEFCVRHQARNRWLRVVFLLDPEATWNWLALPRESRTALEDACDASLAPGRWSLSAIRRRLAQHEKMDKDEVCSEVLRVTGGWPILLDVLLETSGKQTDLRPICQILEAELTDAASGLRQRFRDSLGFSRNQTATRVLQFVAGEHQVPIELLTPDLVGGIPELSASQCEQAREYLTRLSMIDTRGDLLVADAIVVQTLAQP